MLKLLAALSFVLLLLAPSTYPQAQTLEPGPTYITMACRTLAGVRAMVEVLGGNAGAKKAMLEDCGVIRNPMPWSRLLELFGQPETVYCATDEEGDRYAVVFVENAPEGWPQYLLAWRPTAETCSGTAPDLGPELPST